MLCLCEFEFSVQMEGPGICVLYLADTCALLLNMYLLIADITNTDLG